MYGNDGQKKDTLKGKESRFHDIIHNVNNDGLEDMAWPGALARQRDKRDNRTNGKEEEQSAKTTQTQTTTQTQEKPSDSSTKSLSGSQTLKVEEKAKKEIRQPQPKSEHKTEPAARKTIEIKDEWSDFLHALENYDSSKEKVKRYGIYLPEKVYNTYQTIFNRDMSAAMSVELLKFIERNKDNMVALISQKSDLL